MSDQSPGPGWWQASNGGWYPPQAATLPPPPPPPPPPVRVPPKTAQKWSVKKNLLIVGAVVVVVVTALVIGSLHKSSAAKAETVYVADIGAKTSTVTTNRDALLRVGHAECSALDSGVPIQTAVDVLKAGATDPSFEAVQGVSISGVDQGSLLAYAIFDLCPSHRAALNVWLATH